MHPSAESATTRRLAVLLASALGGVACAVAVPLAWPKVGMGASLGIALGMAAWPLILGVRRPVEAQQRGGAHALWQYSGLLLSALLSPLAHHYFHPLLRVLNLSGASFTLVVDGQELLTLPPTSSESPVAGAEVRLGAGAHQLAAKSAQGITVSQTAARLVAGGLHLYAPMHNGQCFWLETAHYGRAGDTVDRQTLSPDEQFWLLPAEVDFWFAAPPESSGGSRLSGGAVTAVRQGPCLPLGTAR